MEIRTPLNIPKTGLHEIRPWPESGSVSRRRESSAGGDGKLRQANNEARDQVVSGSSSGVGDFASRQSQVTTPGAPPMPEATHEYDRDENGELCATVTRKADLSR